MPASGASSYIGLTPGGAGSSAPTPQGNPIEMQFRKKIPPKGIFDEDFSDEEIEQWYYYPIEFFLLFWGTAQGIKGSNIRRICTLPLSNCQSDMIRQVPGFRQFPSPK